MSQHPQYQSAPAHKKSKSLVLIVLAIVLFGGLCTCGILSSLAIPAFLKAIKKSKVSEADGIMRKASQGILLKMEQTCVLPPALLPTSEAPEGGAKVMPDATASKAWEPYRVSFRAHVLRVLGQARWPRHLRNPGPGKLRHRL